MGPSVVPSALVHAGRLRLLSAMHHNTAIPPHRNLHARRVWALIGIAAVLVACGGRLPDRGAVTAAPGMPFVLAVMTETEGALAAESDGITNAVQLAVARHGPVMGLPVEVRGLGGGCDAGAAARQAGALAGDARVLGLVGPVCSHACVAAEVEIGARALVMVTPRCTDVAVTRQGYPNALRTVFSDSFNAAATARLANDVLGVRSTFLVHDGTLYGRGMRDVFKLVYGKDKLAGNVEALAGSTDYSAVVARIRRSSAGMVYYAGFPEDAARFVAQLRGGGVALPVVLTDTALAPPGLASLAGAAAEGVFVTEPVHAYGAGYDAFVVEYQQRYGATPPPYAAEAYDAATVILRAAAARAERTGEGVRVDRRALQQAARNVRLDGASGQVRFRKNGDRREGVAARLLQVESGRLVERRIIVLDD